MLIDVSYFTAGPRQILNSALGNGTSKEDCVIGQYIESYQSEFLLRALGKKVGTDVLRYLDDGWAKDADDMELLCSKLRIPFADYVLFHVLRDAGQTATITGLVKLKVANSYVEPIMRQVSTWNRMANQLNLFAEWVDGGECPLQGIVIDKYLLESINRFNL